MNPSARRTTRLLAAAAAVCVTALTLSSCSASSGGSGGIAAKDQSQQTIGTGNAMDVKVPAPVADIKLVDQDGHSFTLRSLRGKVVVLAPVLTFCQETCPMTSANMHQAAQQASAAGQGNVVFLELTVDPDRDTPQRLHAYEKVYGALPDWTLATGDPAAVRKVWKAFGVITQKTKADDTVTDWLTGKKVKSYDIHHQDVVVAIDAQGRERWITVGRPDARRTQLPGKMKTFLNGEGKHNLAAPGAGGWTATDLAQAVRYVQGLGQNGA